MSKKTLALGPLALALTACSAQTPPPSSPVSAPAEGPMDGSSSAEAPAEEAPATSGEPTPDPRDVSRYVWDLTDLYPDPEAWDRARQEVLARIDELEGFQGQLGRSPNRLLTFLETMFEVAKDMGRVFTYASLGRDEDQRVPEAQARFERARAMGSEYQKATAWVQPELLAVGQRRIERFIRVEEGLAPYTFFLRDTVRQAPHTLDEKGEQLLASAGLVLSSPGQIYQMLVNADVEWPTLTLGDGTKAHLTQAGYSKYRRIPDREDRERVFDTFWGAWSQYLDSIGAMMSANVQSHVFRARARNYGSAVEAALDDSKIPVAVYDTLIRETNAALPTLHRYFRLRARMLGVDDLGYFDIYPPLVRLEDDERFDIERSKTITLAALAPFGEDYLEKLRMAFSQRWMHGQPAVGKRSGAYMNDGAYDVHPYILLNHNDDYESLSTFAHEWGHAVHSLLAKERQPYPTAGYSIFTAELASTINEILLVEHMIDEAETKDEKLFYLGQALEAVRGTLFRQAMFAEFERAIHTEVENGAPLSGSRLSEMYLSILRKYHGHDEGVMTIKEVYGSEWAYIPHFYYDFYVYQYATSISGAAWFAERFLNGDDSARVAFLEVLSAGGSDYPYEILTEVGLDLAQPGPYRAAFRRMNDIMDRMEALLEEP